jgi:hypothetical protein
MDASTIINALSSHKGQHVLATWQRVARVFKDCPLLITKRTSAWVRAGIDYSNLAKVKAKRTEAEALTAASGGAIPLPELPALPSWSEWVEFPFVLRNTKNWTKQYVRLYPAVFANLATPHVEWAIDGKPATYNEVEPYLLASEKRDDSASDSRPDCFTVAVDDVIGFAVK